ncbi:hypothetical protein ACGIF2_10810 [Cellulomonas sp. P22]|uniref:hypothetical protein n=1 Tax=Cellulomonas sp. P22 TaxID=3373189 RepID=UPI00378B8EB2
MMHLRVERSVLDATSHSWRDIIALAAWAALGDADALSALHRAGQKVDGPAMVVHRYLLAAAAEQAGQSELADSVWRDVAAVTEPTMVVLRRNVVADVFHRSTSDVESAATTLGRSARAVIDMMPFPEDDLCPTRDVVDRLEARGDHASPSRARGDGGVPASRAGASRTPQGARGGWRVVA